MPAFKKWLIEGLYEIADGVFMMIIMPFLILYWYIYVPLFRGEEE